MGQDLSGTTKIELPNATPNPQNIPEPGAAFGREQLPNATPNPQNIPKPGAAFGREQLPNVTPNPQNIPKPGAAFGREATNHRRSYLPNAAPLQCYLDCQPVAFINSSLKSAIDVS